VTTGHRSPRTLDGWRGRAHAIIYEHETTEGKAFDVALILAIAASVAAVMLESIASVRARFGDVLLVAEWTFTILFTLEYVLRLLIVRRPLRYALSFYGLVDLLAILPTWLAVVVPGAQVAVVVRTLRILRVFRVLKLGRFMREFEVILGAIAASMRKISVFLVVLLCLDVIFGSAMYLIEGPEHGFTSIPRGVYWAIVTMTTVGYGDISPQTPLGQTLAAGVMILGYSIIAVPTGLVTAQVLREVTDAQITGKACPDCGYARHGVGAKHCRECGSEL
jgi:voltage-gated potassium channel